MRLEVCDVAPPDWPLRSVEEVCTRVTSGGTPSRARPEFFAAGTWPWVKTQELRDGWVRETEEHITDDAVRNSSAKVLPPQTVMVAMYGATAGMLGMLASPMTCNQACCALVADPRRCDPRYLYYALLGSRTEIISLAVGAAQQNLSGQTIRALQMPFPPLDEQRAIAEVLGALDDKVELNRQMNRTLEEMASALFERMMVAVDDEPTLEVPVQTLIDRRLLIVGDGYRAKNSELAPSGLPFARAGNIDAGFLFSDAELLGWPAVKRAGSKVSVPLDVVFTSKGTVGRFAFVTPTTPRFAYSPQLCFWRSVDHAALSPYFLYQWMRSRRFLEQVDAVKGQTDMADYVSLTDQRLMRVASPAPALQRQLRDEVGPLWDLHFANTDESKTLTALRDTLLPKLLSGEVRLKQAEKLAEAAL